MLSNKRSPVTEGLFDTVSMLFSGFIYAVFWWSWLVKIINFDASFLHCIVPIAL